MRDLAAPVAVSETVSEKDDARRRLVQNSHMPVC